MAEESDDPARVTISITLNPKARQIVENIRRDTGVPSTTAMERLLEWFAGLDRKHRLALLNKDQETRKELALLSLMELAGEPPADIRVIPLEQRPGGGRGKLGKSPDRSRTPADGKGHAGKPK